MQRAPAPDVIAERYKLLGVLGRGGMGEVWDGTDLRLGRPVAVKLLREDLAGDPEFRRRFEAEARAAAGLVHPNVVGVFDTGEHSGIPYIVMERLPGLTLADEIAGGPLEPARVIALARDVLAALEVAHRAGIVHRDIKPGNILLVTGSGPASASLSATAKVADFGIAKAAEGLGQDLTVTGQVLGTPAYFAPERLAGGPATARSDLFALGVVLYEALAGARPFEGDTPMSLAYAITHAQPPPLVEAVPGVDPALASAIERALEKDPEQRFPSAGEMARSLEGLAGPTPGGDSTRRLRSDLGGAAPGPSPTGSTPAPTSVDALPPWSLLPRRGLVPVLALVLAVVLVLGVVLVVAGSAGRDRAPTQAEPRPTPSTAPSSGLPEPLDRALDELEEAVDR